MNRLERKFPGKEQILGAWPRSSELQLRRDDGAVRAVVLCSTRPRRARPVPKHRRVDRARLGIGRGEQTQRRSTVLRQLSDHPASELLHELSRLKNFGVVTLQAEDEIAAANIALGASFAGQLGVTGTSGPGMDLKAETLGLAVIMELPMVIVDVQRAGLQRACRETEAADLLLAMYGRHGSRPCRSSPRAPGALFRRRHRGGPHRRDLQDARDPPVRYVPRELLRAVADPRPRLAADLRADRHRPEPRRRVPAVSEGRAPRAAVGDPRTGARAPDRRPERRTSPATSATTPRTTRR